MAVGWIRQQPDRYRRSQPPKSIPLTSANIEAIRQLELHTIENCLLQLERLDILALNIPGDGGLWFYRAVADRVNSVSERNQAAVVAD
jgi:hypothetical protein